MAVCLPIGDDTMPSEAALVQRPPAYMTGDGAIQTELPPLVHQVESWETRGSNGQLELQICHTGHSFPRNFLVIETAKFFRKWCARQGSYFVRAEPKARCGKS